MNNQKNRVVKKKVGVFGHYGTDNLGDEAIIAAVLQNIRKHVIDPEIVGFSMRPNDTMVRHKIKAYPIRIVDKPKISSPATKRNLSVGAAQNTESAQISSLDQDSAGYTERSSKNSLKKLVRKIYPLFWILKKLQALLLNLKEIFRELLFLISSYKILDKTRLDLFIVAGSGQLEDEWGGPWQFPYTVWKWVTLARITGAKVVFLSVGAGPINSRLSGWFIKSSLNRAFYHSFRDSGSAHLIRSLGVKQACFVKPDLAHNLDEITGDLDTDTSADNNNLSIGINPMPFFDSRYWHSADQDRYGKFVSVLAEFTNHLTSKGYKPFFFATQPKDELVIEDIIDQVDSPAFVSVKSCVTVNHLMSILTGADVLVACRFHGILLSLHLDKVVLGIGKDKKQIELMKDVGLEDYLCTFEDLSVGTLTDRFSKLIGNRETETKKIQIVNNKYRQDLDLQYEHVFSML